MSVVQLFTNGQLRVARSARAIRRTTDFPVRRTTRRTTMSVVQPRQRSPGLALADPGLNTVGLPGLTSWPSRAGKSFQRLTLPGKPKYGYPSGIGIWPLPRRSLFYPFRSKRLLNKRERKPESAKVNPAPHHNEPCPAPRPQGAGQGSHENLGRVTLGG